MEKLTDIKKEFVPYDLAFELKELGFDEPCFGYYEPNGDFNYIESNILKDFPYLAKNSEWKDLCGAPTFSQTFRWFREKYGVKVISIGGDEKNKYNFLIVLADNKQILGSEPTYNSYEEAELDCLMNLIEFVKTKNNKLWTKN